MHSTIQTTDNNDEAQVVHIVSPKIQQNFLYSIQTIVNTDEAHGTRTCDVSTWRIVRAITDSSTGPRES